ncbi:MAG: hypothetical protein H6672_21060 [Anaerolineaceae bacterium]|nr:hypothetical protein [Anaerolineaceae bacterium]
MSDEVQVSAGLLAICGLGGILFAVGLLAIFRQRVSVGIGGRNTRPLFSVTITGIGAVAFGILLLISGIGIGLPYIPFLLPSLSHFFPPISLMYIYVSGYAALALAVIVFVFIAIMQTAIAFGKRIREQNEKNHTKRPVDTPPEI